MGRGPVRMWAQPGTVRGGRIQLFALRSGTPLARSAHDKCALLIQAPSMPALAPSNTVYTLPVAKVMVSMPQDLLDRVDSLAAKRGLTRSGFLQGLAERELNAAEEKRRAEMRRLLELAGGDYGGDATKLVREDRNSR